MPDHCTRTTTSPADRSLSSMASSFATADLPASWMRSALKVVIGAFRYDAREDAHYDRVRQKSAADRGRRAARSAGAAGPLAAGRASRRPDRADGDDAGDGERRRPALGAA